MDYPKALEHLQDAVTLTPKIKEALVELIDILLQLRKIEEAKKWIETAELFDPQSDLGSFARQYQDLIEKRIFLERPFRFTLGVFGQYDTNMVLKPTESALAPGVTDEESGVMNTTFRANYVPILKGPWLFNARYSFISSLHQKNTHSHDFIGNSISICPGYNFGRFALNLAANYGSTMVRDPSYKRYVDSLSVGPLLRALLNQNHILELFAGYNRNEYFKSPLTPEDDRNSEGMSTYISWMMTPALSGTRMTLIILRMAHITVI